MTYAATFTTRIAALIRDDGTRYGLPGRTDILRTEIGATGLRAPVATLEPALAFRPGRGVRAAMRASAPPAEFVLRASPTRACQPARSFRWLLAAWNVHRPRRPSGFRARATGVLLAYERGVHAHCGGSVACMKDAGVSLVVVKELLTDQDLHVQVPATCLEQGAVAGLILREALLAAGRCSCGLAGGCDG